MTFTTREVARDLFIRARNRPGRVLGLSTGEQAQVYDEWQHRVVRARRAIAAATDVPQWLASEPDDGALAAMDRVLADLDDGQTDPQPEPEPAPNTIGRRRRWFS